MTEAEFFARAQSDDSFRRTKIEEWSYYRNVGLGLLAVEGALLLAYVAYAGLAEHRLPNLNAGLGSVALTAIVYAQARVRLAALRAIPTARAA
ncbi:MAG TPA: hypothetical protein PLU52_04420 [Opitutaceae bacterium]|nr:hypothetical protein [Opitutaceae bacterium]